MSRLSRDFKYSIFLPKIKKHWMIDQWCVNQFGKRWSITDNREGVWCCFWRGWRGWKMNNVSEYEYLFVHERDLLWFSLRWLEISNKE